MYELKDEVAIESSELRALLLREGEETGWSKKTQKWMIRYVDELTSKYGESWKSGRLPMNLLPIILLPEHRHSFEDDGSPTSFVVNTPLNEAVRIFKEEPDRFSERCREHISALQGCIREAGFTTTITLVVLDGSLKHVDGLHRLIALGILIDEGWEYEPILAFICRKDG